MKKRDWIEDIKFMSVVIFAGPLIAWFVVGFLFLSESEPYFNEDLTKNHC